MSKNESSFGAYEILRTGDNISVTIIATGSETSLAIDVSHKLATEKHLFKSNINALPRII